MPDRRPAGRQMKQRIEALEIRVQKLNDYGATPLTQAEAEEKYATPEKTTRVTAGQLKRFRMSHQLSQAAMGALLGATPQKYARWESGKSIMLPVVEEKFRSIQSQKMSQLRTQLQELGFFQANGKRTKFRKGQDDETDEKSNIRKKVSSGIISRVQMRELRLKLGCTHPQMAARCGVHPQTWSNWEYGNCRPPEAIAKKLLAQYEECVGPASPEPTPIVIPHHQRPKSKRKVYESELMPIAKIRAGRKASGLSMREIAQRVGVPLSTYNNWEAGNSKPSTEHVEKLLEVFGAEPTKSVTDSVRTHALAPKPRTNAATGYKYPAETLREFRVKHHLTRSQMARLMRVRGAQYANWEAPGRGVPPNHVSKFHVLSKLSVDGITKRLRTSPVVSSKPQRIGRGEAYSFPAEFLVALRTKLGISGVKLAKLLGIPMSQYKNWEAPGRGVPPNSEEIVKRFVELGDAGQREKMAALGIGQSHLRSKR